MYKLTNYHGSEFAILDSNNILVFRSYSLDKIHDWFKNAGHNKLANW